jgi:alpha/beta superfamily hydrolase
VLKEAAMEREKVYFVSDSYKLEGFLAYRQKHVPAPGIVICHPHPQFGGSMDNNVVQALLQGFASRGYVALAFNFRGVGMSEGMYGGGAGEQRDVKAALDFLEGLPQTQGKRLGLSGYSFGAWVGLNVSIKDRRVQCVGAVSPPVSMFPFDFLEGYGRPVIIVSGDQDQFCAPGDMDRLLNALSGPKEWNVLSGEDHFYFYKAQEASEYICQKFPYFLPLTSKA